MSLHPFLKSLLSYSMDELDKLLEELAQTSSEPAAAPVPPKTLAVTPVMDLSDQAHTSAPVSRGSKRSMKNVYNELPAPVEADGMSPSTATRELDSLMNKLLGLDLEIPDQAPSAPAPPLAEKSGKEEVGDLRDDRYSLLQGPLPNMEKALPSRSTDAIDNLLDTLNSDMEKMGVRTAAKGHCASCGKNITGKMITALGQVWHPEHFVCVVCHVELGTSGFFERERQAYCEKDYQNLFSPRCAYCKGPILQNILTAMDQMWHPEHFFCSHCGDLFGPEGFLEREGKPYCNRDFYRLFAPKCSGCGEPVRENYLSAANGTWHPDCFVCADCLKPFVDGCFLELDGRPLCSLHYHSRQGTLCGGCGEPISGRCISALERKFHPEHFVCAFCLRQLCNGVFQEQAGKPYCAACHAKLFL